MVASPGECILVHGHDGAALIEELIQTAQFHEHLGVHAAPLRRLGTDDQASVLRMGRQLEFVGFIGFRRVHFNQILFWGGHGVVVVFQGTDAGVEHVVVLRRISKV